MRTISKLLRYAAVALAVTLGAGNAHAGIEYWQPEGWEKYFYVVHSWSELHQAITNQMSSTVLRLYICENVTVNYGDDVHKALKDWFVESGADYDGALAIVAGLLQIGTGDEGARFKVTFNGNNNQFFDFSGGDADEFHARFVGINFLNCGNMTGVAYGGAVRANNNASFYGCTFTNCKSYNTGGALYLPGDVQNQSSDRWSRNRFCGQSIAVEKCVFYNCESKYGGALAGDYGTSGHWFNNFWDSEFENCTANGGYGGAIYCGYDGIYRCKFSNCKAPGQYGGALYACGDYETVQEDDWGVTLPHGIRECLFENCTAYRGAAISCGNSTDSRESNCTFINCPSTDTSYPGALYDANGGDNYLYNSLFYGSDIGNIDDGKHDKNYIVDDPKYFYNIANGDYHFNICNEDGTGGYSGDPYEAGKGYCYSDETDIDRRSLKDCAKYIAGCFSYYTKDQWKEELYKKKPFEYESCDPLLVTTTVDSNDNKDGIVSLREALTYFGDEKIRAKSSHQERIDFQLAGSRVITLKGDAVSVAQVLKPLMINGGDNGITLEHESNPEWAIRFNGASADIRTFQNVTVKVGLYADTGGAEVGFRFVNCNFVGGDTPFASGRVGTWVGWDRYDIEWRFERCTFANHKAGDYILAMGEYKTTATFDACTFTGNSPEIALIRGAGKAVYFRNCTFFDNSVRTMSPAPRPNPTDPDPPYPSENYFNCIICQSDCNPSASSSDNAISEILSEVLDSAMPVKKTVNGVEQIAFKPMHKGTARAGHASYSDWRQVPGRDIFNQESPTTRYLSLGSYYMADYETPSLLVNVPWDVTDPYDDQITLREALTYAADPANDGIIVGTTVRPIFSESAFPDGKVELTLDHSISFFEEIYTRYPCELQPGDDQTLTITAPKSPDGAFRIGEGMKMRVKDTTFKTCVTGNRGGVGGAIGSSGELLVNGCRFDACATDQSEGVGGALFLAGGSKTFIYGTTFSNCKSNLGGAIGSCGDLVAICVTLTGNSASTASAVAVADSDRTLFANATIANNTANSGGAAFRVMGGENAGLINSIVAGNAGGNLAGSWSEAPTTYNKSATGNWYAYSLTEGTLADIFLTANAVSTNMPNGVTQLYYPLKSASAAKDGAFVFTKGGLDQNGEVVAGSWPEKVGYSTSIDGFYPYPRELNGAQMGDKYGADFNGYPTRDLTGALITDKDTGMGAMPSFAADVIDASSLVNTLEDVVDDRDGKVSLREAAEYAMAHGGQVNFDSRFLLSSADFKLNNQIVVPEGCSFELKSPSWRRITLHATSNGGNRFFRVEGGGTLKLEGITLRGGTARGIYGIMSPTDDSNGGAVCGVVSGGDRDSKKISDLSFVNCTFQNNQAPKGYGGAIYAEGLLSIKDCNFLGNSAGYDGGAVYSKAAMMTMTGGEVASNKSSGNGGGIGISPGSATNIVKNVTITGNEAKARGGGVYSGDGQSLGYVLLQDVIATGNRANSELSVDQNVFTGAGYTFNEQYVLRVNRKYYEVKKDDLGIERIELSDEAAPVLGAIDFGSAASTGKAAITVSNVIPGLEYGLGHAETPVGPYTVDNWVKATSEGDLNLEAPAEGASGFYRVMAREAE